VWEYIGQYRVRESSEERHIIEAEKIRGKDDNVHIVLYLESKSEAEAALNTQATSEKEVNHGSLANPSEVEADSTEAAGNAPPTPNEEPASDRKGGRRPRQPDPEKRALVELAAVKCVLAHYAGYELEDRQCDYVGWDFEAMKNGEKLFLEVKGVSGSALCVELTPNEYQKMQQNPSQYRVCVVVSALEEDRILHVLRYVPKTGRLISETGLEVRIKEETAARLFAC